jgi:hypothetical protein
MNGEYKKYRCESNFRDSAHEFYKTTSSLIPNHNEITIIKYINDLKYVCISNNLILSGSDNGLFYIGKLYKPYYEFNQFEFPAYCIQTKNI